MDKFESQFVGYAHHLDYSDLLPEAIQSTKERFLDSLAVALAAYNTTPVQAARNLALQSSSQKGAILLGATQKAPVYEAAFYLSTMIRALDWNDTYLNKEPAHPSDNIGACLAVADFEHGTGKELILSIVLSYELHCRLCDAAGIRKKGWDHVTYGSIASSLAACKLMKFSQAQMRDALAIAMTTGNYLRQTRMGTISNWKAAAFAQACQNAVRAAYCVKHGFTGPRDIFEGQYGLINQIIRDEFDLAPRFGGQDGQSFKIIETYIKYFPAEYHSQSAIWAALDLRKIIGSENLSGIEKIHVETSSPSYEIIGKEPAKWRPETKETADHSLPYIVAVALMDGEISLKQFDEGHLADPLLQELVQKVSVSEKEDYTDLYGKSFPNKISITMANGTVYVKEVLDPKGHPHCPFSRDELENKFRVSSDSLFDSKQQDDIIKSVWNLEQLTNIRELMKMMVAKEICQVTD